MTYYKATRPDGTSFYDGKTPWAVGETTTIEPADQLIRLCSPDVLHASNTPSETLIGGSWPCRLFEVTGEAVVTSNHKYGFHNLTVTREIEAWRALGPNGQQVAALIVQADTVTPEQARQLRSACDAAWYAAWDAARYVAWGAARYAAWYAAWGAAGDVACAYVVRDRISVEHFTTLAGPWISVMGEPVPA
jgi:hypothetical protein